MQILLRYHTIYLAMCVKAGISWGFDIRKLALVLRSSCPGRVRSWRGHHHEKWPVVRLVLEKV